MNIKNTKKVKIRSRLQQITKSFPDYRYDMETINDEWLVHFTNDKIKFVIEISSVDDDINNFKVFYDKDWLIYSEKSFETIIEIAEKKIKEIYG
jgi:hypothetical protein